MLIGYADIMNSAVAVDSACGVVINLVILTLEVVFYISLSRHIKSLPSPQ